MTWSQAQGQNTRVVEDRLKALSPENAQLLMRLYLEVERKMSSGRDITRVELSEMLRTTTHLPVPTALTLDEIEAILAAALFVTDALPETRPYTLDELNELDRLGDNTRD